MKWLFLLLPIVSFAGPYEALKPATVKMPNGTGVVVSVGSKNVILTNWHVCVHYNKAEVEINGGKAQAAKIKFDTSKDLCAMTVDGNTTPLIIAQRMKYTDKLYTRGYPHMQLKESSGYFIVNTAFSFILSGIRIKQRTNITTLYAAPGSSGSPVVNEKGELVGLINNQDYENNPYSAGVIPLQYIIDFVNTLR